MIKKSLAIVALAALTISSASAQGTLTFNNRIVGIVDAKIFNQDGVTGLAGTGFSVQLYVGAAGATADALTAAAGVVSTFRTGAGAGYFNSLGDVAIPGFAGGQIVALQLRAWDNQGGTITSYETASIRGVSNVFNTTDALGGAGNPPATAATLQGLQSFSVVPEPSVIALALLGAGALFLRRKKA
jgi:hypothetical protein